MRALFVGAHNDDIDIGAGGVAAKLASSGVETHWLILTSEPDANLAKERRLESLASAAQAGLAATNVHFFEALDGQLGSTGEAVGSLRQFIATRELDPDVIFVHSEHSDSHNDHNAAHRLIKAAFRKKLLLSYYIVNSGVRNSFEPEVYVDTTQQQIVKRQMLLCHKTQNDLGRIQWKKIEERDTLFSSNIGGSHCEAFAMHVQEGCEYAIEILETINNCRFTTLWRTILGATRLSMLYGRTVSRIARPQTSDTPVTVDVDVKHTLSKLFAAKFGHYDGVGTPPQIQSFESTLYDDEAFFALGSTLVIGGTSSNNGTLRVFNHLSGIRYQMGHDMPYYGSLYVYDTNRRRKIEAEYIRNENGQLEVVRDVGLLTIMRSAYHEDGLIVGAMGVHGGGTRAVGRILACEPEAPDIQEFAAAIRSGRHRVIQMLIQSENGGLTAKINRNSLYYLT